MTSQARIDANRRNAQKSTGPKSDAGKDKVRLNALKHGLDAGTIVLPHEDADAYRRRLDDWSEELRPPGKLGRYLAERAVKLSWQLDRADAHETARLTKRARELPRERERGRRRRAAGLVRAVLSDDPPRGRSRWDCVARLEFSAQGCEALLEAWTDIEAELAKEGRAGAPGEVPGEWMLDCATSAFRLLGSSDESGALGDEDPLIREVAELAAELRRRRHEAVLRRMSSRPAKAPAAPEARPFDERRLRSALRELVATGRAWLVEAIAAHQAELPDPAAEDAARASFDDSPEGERLHRYQERWGRGLLKTLDAIERLRHVRERADDDGSVAGGRPDAPHPRAAKGALHVSTADEPSPALQAHEAEAQPNGPGVQAQPPPTRNVGEAAADAISTPAHEPGAANAEEAASQDVSSGPISPATAPDQTQSTTDNSLPDKDLRQEFGTRTRAFGTDVADPPLPGEATEWRHPSTRV